MGYVAYLMLRVLEPIFDINTSLGVFLQGFIAGIAGLFTGAVFLWLIKNPEFIAIIAFFKNRSKNKEA